MAIRLRFARHHSMISPEVEPSSTEPQEAESLDSSKPSNSAVETKPPEEELGGLGESLEPEATGKSDSESPSSTPAPAAAPPPRKRFLGRFKINVYILLFLLVLLIAIMALVIGIQRSRKEALPTEITTQTLSTDAVNQLKGNDVKIGDVKQTLSVESNAVFAGRVLVQGGTDIAGALKVTGDTSVANLSVSATANIQKAQINDLAVSGNTGIQGTLTVQKSINVTGGGSFGGAVTAPQLTVDTLQLSKDLQLNGHIDAGGNTPSKGSSGSALGSGGTSSIGGTDTAGTVAIGVGGGPSAGCFVTINFAKKFNATPHVVISPASSDAASLDYYVTRNTTSFSICANTPQSGKNYTFDYVVID